MFLMYFTKSATYFLRGHVTGPCCQLYCSSMECDSLVQSSQRSYRKIGMSFPHNKQEGFQPCSYN